MSSKTRGNYGRLGKQTVVVITIAVITVALLAAGFEYATTGNANPLNVFGQSTTTTNGSIVNTGCTNNAIQGTLTGYGGTTVTSGAVTRYIVQNGELTYDSTPSVSTNAYGPSSSPYQLGYYEKFTATAAYPQWYQVNGTPQNNFYWQTQGINALKTFAVNCFNAGANVGTVFSEKVTMFNAPASGTSATTNVAAVAVSPTGLSLTKTTQLPGSTTVNFNLNVNSPNVMAMPSETIPGTSDNSVYNYGTSTQYPCAAGMTTGCASSGSVTMQGYMILALNQTGVIVTAPGLQPINLNTVTSGSLVYLIPVTGCGPTPSSTTSSQAATCISVPVSIGETLSAQSHHIAITAIFVDNQQAAYIQTHFTDPAVTSFPASGAAAGVPAGFTFLTPTSNGNVGAPAPLIEQSYTVIMEY